MPERPRSPAERCRRRFLDRYPGGFEDPAYLNELRDPREDAHERWTSALARARYRERRDARDHAGIVDDAIDAASRSGLLLPAETKAFRAATAKPPAARRVSVSLYSFLYGRGQLPNRLRRYLGQWGEVDAALLGWPLLTIFPFLAEPRRHLFLRPRVMKSAARAYARDLAIEPPPAWPSYVDSLRFAQQVQKDLADLGSRDMLDVQAFLHFLAGAG